MTYTIFVADSARLTIQVSRSLTLKLAAIMMICCTSDTPLSEVHRKSAVSCVASLNYQNYNDLNVVHQILLVNLLNECVKYLTT